MLCEAGAASFAEVRTLRSLLQATVPAALASALMVRTPLLALIGAQLAFAVTDEAMDRGRSGGIDATRRPLRRFAVRAAATVATWVVLYASRMLAIASSVDLRRWGLPTLAILAAATLYAPATIDAPPNSDPLGVGARVAWLDLAAIIWSVSLAASVHDEGRTTTAVAAIAIAFALIGRALMVGVAAGGPRPPRDAIHAALGAIAWVGAAGFSVVIAGDAIAWSGLGAGMVLAAAAIIREGRRPRPSATIALSHASFGFVVATMLGLVVIAGRI